MDGRIRLTLTGGSELNENSFAIFRIRTCIAEYSGKGQANKHGLIDP